MNPTSKPVTIYLVDDGTKRYLSAVSETNTDKEITLHFTFNTYSSFQQRTGKFWMDWWMEIIRNLPKADLVRQTFQQIKDDKMDEAAAKVLMSERELTGTEALSIISMADVQAFIWAAAHDLVGAELEVRRRFKFGEVGLLMDLNHFPGLLGPIMSGLAENVMKDRKPQGDVVEDEEVDVTKVRPMKRTHQRPRSVGGAISGPSDADILASAIKR